MSWDFSAPQSNKKDDKSVDFVSKSLIGKRIALLISGSIAAFQTPDLIRLLRKRGADVQVYCSHTALKFVTEASLYWASNNKVYTGLSSQVEHLGETDFDLYLVAPATYNTINKFAQGIADSILTVTLASALGYLHLGKTKILLCPTLHYSMHNCIFIDSLAKLSGYKVLINKPRQEEGKNKLPELSNLVGKVEEILNV